MPLNTDSRKIIVLLRIIGIIGLFPIVFFLYTLAMFGFKEDPELIKGFFSLGLLSSFGIVPFFAAHGLTREKHWANLLTYLIAVVFIFMGIGGIIKTFFMEDNALTMVISIAFSLALTIPGILIIIFFRRSKNFRKG